MAISKTELRKRAEIKKQRLIAEKNRENPYGVYRLFNAYIESTTLTDTECFDRCGLRKSDLKRKMLRDSMELSTMIDFVEANGDKISFSYFGHGGKEVDMVGVKEFLAMNKLHLSRLSFITLGFMQYGKKRSDVAKELGLDPSTLQKWFEKDDIKFRNVIKIAKALGCSVQMDIMVVKKNDVKQGSQVLKGSLTFINEEDLA